MAAIRAAQLGGEVIVVEKEKIGGTCLNWGCIPSKIYKQTADTLKSIQKAEDFCISGAGTPKVDINLLKQRTANIIGTQAQGIQALLEKNNVKLLYGTGKILNSTKLEVETEDGNKEVLCYDKLILATGSSPMPLPFLPFDGEKVLSSDHIFDMAEIPASITIVGGGVIGCEFACILSSFGSKVTLIEGLGRVLSIPSVDEECSKLLLREMKKKKISVKLKSTLLSANSNGTSVTMEIGASDPEKRKKIETIESEKVLVCIGRKANSSNLGLDNAGVAITPQGWILSDDQLQTNVENIYAIGDALGPEKVMLAHTASTEAEIVTENCFGAQKKMTYSAVPSAIFTMPEIGCVGLSQKEAEEKHGAENVGAESALFRGLGKAHVIGKIAGQAKIIFQKEGRNILGVHIAGPHATDLLGEATLAVNAGITVEQLAETIHAHPTLSEIMLETAFKATGLPLHG